MHPYPQLMTIMTTTIIKNEDTDEKQCWAVQRKLGGCVFTLNGTQLVLLQVPGFKELQAFLHCQAFLQTLGGEETDRQTDKRLRTRPNAGCSLQSEAERWGEAPQRLVGHAKERAVSCEMGLSG